MGCASSSVSELHAAVMRGELNLVSQFIERGINVDARDPVLNTPLMIASRFGHFHIVEYLVDQQAQINTINRNGDTPLIWACTEKGGDPKVVDLLLNNGAMINHQNRNGATALRFAATSSFLPIVELLMQKGADQSIPNKKGETPLQVSKARNRRAVYKCLLKLQQEKKEKEKAAYEQKIKDTYFAQVAKSMSFYIAKLLIEGVSSSALAIVTETPISISTSTSASSSSSTTTTAQTVPSSPSQNAADNLARTVWGSAQGRSELEKAIEKGLINNNALLYCWDETKPDHMAARLTISVKLANSLNQFANESLDKITAQTTALAQMFLYEFQRRDRSLNPSPEISKSSKNNISQNNNSKNHNSQNNNSKDNNPQNNSTHRPSHSRSKRLSSREREEKILLS